MRLEQYLTEKFFDSYGNDQYIEVFKNPSKRDLKEIGSEYGYRVFIDLKNKNVYLATSEVWHMTMLDNSPKLRKELGNINWFKYWDGEDKTNEYVIMGDCNSFMKYFNSDSLGSISREADVDNLERIKKLTEWDYKWLSKYGFNPKEIKDMVWNAIIGMEERAA